MYEKKELLKLTICWGIGLLISALGYKLNDGFSIFLLFTGIVFGVHFVFYLLYLLGLKIGKTSAKLERKVMQLDKTDFENNKDYYRKILKNNSPLLLGYLDNFELNKNKIIAELLYLQKRKLINIENDNIKKINGIETEDLKDSETEILNSIKNGKLNIENLNNLREKVSDNAKMLGLVKKKKERHNKEEYGRVIFIIASIILGIVIHIIFFQSIYHEDLLLAGIENPLDLFYFLLVGGNNKNLLDHIYYIVIYLVFMFCPIVIFSAITLSFFVGAFKKIYLQTKGVLYKRTTKGKEINKKLEGLKNYLKDYSLMDERESKEIELWEDYLIYSVMFGHNKKIIEEYEKYIEINE